MKLIVIAGKDLQDLKQDLAKKVGDVHLPIIAKRGLQIAAPRLTEALLLSFQRTTAWRALQGEFRGDNDSDVPAHMGLSDMDAAEAAHEILDVVTRAINFNRPSLVSKGRGGAFSSFANADSIRINLSFDGLEDAIKGIQSGTYTSINAAKRSIVIPWITWLIDGYDYPGYDIEFDTLASPMPSRSGRAIMLYDGGNYSTMDYHNFAERDFEGRSNFVIDALLDEMWMADAAAVLRNAMQEAANE